MSIPRPSLVHPWTAGAWRQLLARRENLPQALLIHGPRGIGKLELARRFAHLILCEDAGADEPCGRCDGCRWFQAGNHPDFRQIQPEALAGPSDSVDEAQGSTAKKVKPSHEIKIDQIRALTDFLNIGSHRGKRRLALFHPAESMNANAANSLLRSLEDTSTFVCFILVSDNYMHLIPTLRSRCIRIAISLPQRDDSIAWLEQAGVTRASDWLAFCGGAPLLAQALTGSDRGARIEKLLELLRAGAKESLLDWPATEREHIEALSEVLQKWAYDQVLEGFSEAGKFFNRPNPKRPMDLYQRRAWLRFALEAGRYRSSAQHPLNPKLFAADLISRMPGLDSNKEIS